MEKEKMDESLVTQIDFGKAMKERFHPYAMDVIEDRALPSASDGLKPVQRRILLSLYDLKLHSNSQYKKCARAVGDCLGRYHPHGKHIA